MLHGLSREEIEEEVGVEIDDEGKVFDVYDRVEYDSLEKWAEAQGGKQDERIYGRNGWD